MKVHVPIQISGTGYFGRSIRRRIPLRKVPTASVLPYVIWIRETLPRAKLENENPLIGDWSYPFPFYCTEDPVSQEAYRVCFFNS